MSEKPKIVSYGPFSTTYEVEGREFTFNWHAQRVAFAHVPDVEEGSRLRAIWEGQQPQ